MQETETTTAALNLHEWTSCEVYGHNFSFGHCVDCGEKQEESDNE